ncbi:MAG: hypothetical protein ACTHM9_12060 [Gemmatimonadales bacterium]
MLVPVLGEAAELLHGYRDLPFLRKPFTYVELKRALEPLLKRGRHFPWRPSGGRWRSRSGRGGGTGS